MLPWKASKDGAVETVHGGGLTPLFTHGPGRQSGLRTGGGVNAALPAGKGECKGSARNPVGEHDFQLAEDHIPVLAPGVPVFHNSLGSQTEHPAQGIIVGEARQHCPRYILAEVQRQRWGGYRQTDHDRRNRGEESDGSRPLPG